MEIEWIKVESSNIDQVGYLDGNLYVKYKSGGLYLYKNVERKYFLSLLGSRSKGQYINQTIKDDYICVKIN